MSNAAGKLGLPPLGVIGFPKQKKPDTTLNDSLYLVYGNLNALSLVAKCCHWNVKGSNFYELHLLFDRIYESAYTEIDPLAELMRARDLDIPVDYGTLASISTIEFPHPRCTADQFVLCLLAAIKEFGRVLDSANIAATKENCFASINLLGEIAQSNANRYYLVNSTAS